jgi:outer membrane protein assembly factor BamB
MNNRTSLLTSLLCLALTSGCSWLGSEDEENLKPAELVDFDASYRLQTQWRANVGAEARQYWATLEPAASDQTLFTADHYGKVTATDVATGRAQWTENFDTPISGGVGYGAELVLFGTIEGQVYALNANDGSLVWRSTVSSEVVASPATNGKIVVVQSIDNRLFALDATSGEVVWQHDSDAPILSVRGTSTAVALNNMVIAAGDSGKLMAFNPDNGALIWETRLSLPKGRTELERMIDIDGKPLLVDDIIYSVSYQGRLGALTRGTGRNLWFQDSSSHHSPAYGNGTVFVTEDSDWVRAFQAGSGRVAWTNEQLTRRELTGPAVISDAAANFVAVADAQGYLHLLNAEDGSFAARTKVKGGAVSAPLLVIGDQLIIQTDGGTLNAYKVIAR